MRHVTLPILLAFSSLPAAAQDIDAGSALFARHCATCHGADATGGGPMAPVLVVQPKDLTQLSAENGGVFPMARVVARIDGGDPLVSHGSAMPVYGDFFAGRGRTLTAPDGTEIETSGPIADLVAYLEHVQGEEI
ncbi:c-type cytochrome [Mesobacterium pallidum]|uniref:c-type cytochrome n=1 Tax=Mesobacterium pallidum TaxID=2872037 RepID=UPI001EE2296F|nr:c-type cytochrome [Mesobacterium pallidum]